MNQINLETIYTPTKLNCTFLVKLTPDYEIFREKEEFFIQTDEGKTFQLKIEDVLVRLGSKFIRFNITENTINKAKEKYMKIYDILTNKYKIKLEELK